MFHVKQFQAVSGRRLYMRRFHLPVFRLLFPLEHLFSAGNKCFCDHCLHRLFRKRFYIIMFHVKHAFLVGLCLLLIIMSAFFLKSCLLYHVSHETYGLSAHRPPLYTVSSPFPESCSNCHVSRETYGFEDQWPFSHSQSALPLRNCASPFMFYVKHMIQAAIGRPCTRCFHRFSGIVLLQSCFT